MRQVTHALLTRPPLTKNHQVSSLSVRLACVRHAASVHPEPGSNSHVKKFARQNFLAFHLYLLQIALLQTFLDLTVLFGLVLSNRFVL